MVRSTYVNFLPFFARFLFEWPECDLPLAYGRPVWNLEKSREVIVCEEALLLGCFLLRPVVDFVDQI